MMLSQLSEQICHYLHHTCTCTCTIKLRWYIWTHACTYFDIEGSLEARGKESSKRSQERGEDGEREGVQGDRIQVEEESTNLYITTDIICVPPCIHVYTRLTLYS